MSEPSKKESLSIPLQVVPVDFDEAVAFVKDKHRHHEPPVGHKFSIGAANESGICGVAIVGRPVSRMADDGWTLEVTRVCSDGTRNVCSMLYRACWRAAQALGYRRLITYTLPAEGGASLRGAGFRCLGISRVRDWRAEWLVDVDITSFAPPPRNAVKRSFARLGCGRS